MRNLVLLRNNLVELPVSKSKLKLSNQLLGTVFSNLAYYGFVPSTEVAEKLQKLSPEMAKSWWGNLEPTLRKATGEDKKMGDYVVYKNFPQEVLDMSDGEYWVNQILMYIGFPNELFTTDAKPRNKMFEEQKLKVLHLASDKSLNQILSSLLKKGSRWTREETESVSYLTVDEKLSVKIADVPFKENMVSVAKDLMKQNLPVSISSAMDVLRLATGLSDGDITFAKNSKFRNFSRQERRYLLNLLDNSTNINEDLARDKNRWKKLLRNLHVGDYHKAYPNITDAYDKLYNDKVHSFNSLVERSLNRNRVADALKLLTQRPGVFARRLYELSSRNSTKTVQAFTNVVDRLTVMQLVKLKRHIQTLSNRQFLTIAPKGNWAKLQIVKNTKSFDNLEPKLVQLIDTALSKKINIKVNLDVNTQKIKLPNNKQELAPFGQGSVFDIPDNVNFIRTASYWECKRGHNVWFDNGWNFFDSNWNSMGAVCWNEPRYPNGYRYSWYGGKDRYKPDATTAAIFSGDPTNSKTADGKACQMIDLYLDKLKAQGVRYAVWNILCFSRIKFSQAGDVFGAMQWGEDAQAGKLFEPSRCQLAFPIKGETYTKYLAYVDVVNRKVVYMDAGLKASTSSAGANGALLTKVMPAFVEYLDSLPSVYDVFSAAKQSKKGTPILFSDANTVLNGEKAYVFKPENSSNKFEKFDINKYLWL